MPPSRRRPTPNPGQAPPVRRPKVAGRRRPAGQPQEQGAPPEERAELPEESEPPERESLSGTLDLDEPPARDPEPAWIEPPAEVDLGTDPESRALRRAPADDVPADEDADEDADAADDGIVDEDPVEETAIRPRPRRPAGKRRAAGTARPADLAAAEAEAKVDPEVRVASVPRRVANPYAVAAVLAVVAVILAGLAVWFRGEASALESRDSNAALTDSATTSAVLGQLTSAIEDTFSYNYTDLGSTQRAVDSTLTGKARCEYDQLFGEVKELAPKQKLILATAVRDIALVRLDGDRAEALVFIDQVSTRVDTNKSTPGDALFGLLARRDGDDWKITEFNMFDQKLVTGQPAPQC